MRITLLGGYRFLSILSRTVGLCLGDVGFLICRFNVLLARCRTVKQFFIFVMSLLPLFIMSRCEYLT